MKAKTFNGKSRLSRWDFQSAIVMILTALLFLGGCAKTASDVKLTQTRVDAAAVKPGLAVLYFDTFYRHISQMPTGEAALKEGKPGKPIPFLNHRFGEGPVFDSGISHGVGVQMTGFVKFPSPGKYLFKAKSNDGIRIFINNQKVIDDPTVHSDAFSAVTLVDLDKPGWYPLLLQYFQRKATATLELYWQGPGQADFSIVPAEAFGHIPTPPKAD